MVRAWKLETVGTFLMTLLTACILDARVDHPGQPDPVETRLRTGDSASATLLKDAMRRSSTVRELATHIEASNLLVSVTVSNDPGKWRGNTRLVSSGGGFRRVAVRISVSLAPDDQIAVLGHELQHVCELADAPNVTDAQTMAQLFQRIGDPGNRAGDRYETAAAQTVERRVREEVWRVR